MIWLPLLTHAFFLLFFLPTLGEPSQMREVAVLISLLIGRSAEETKLCSYGWCHCSEVKLNTHVVLENVKRVTKQVKVKASVLPDR